MGTSLRKLAPVLAVRIRDSHLAAGYEEHPSMAVGSTNNNCYNNRPNTAIINHHTHKLIVPTRHVHPNH